MYLSQTAEINAKLSIHRMYIRISFKLHDISFRLSFT